MESIWQEDGTTTLATSSPSALDLSGAQVSALIRILIEKGAFTNEEWLRTFNAVYKEHFE